MTARAAQEGTERHALAAELIRLKVKLPRSSKSLNAFVNDSIGYRMQSEVSLFYSENCFGHADSAGFDHNTFRCYDYKSGEIEAKIDQLLIYAALFCLEYRFKPFEIEYDLRIYQNDQVLMHVTDPDDIMHIMDRIVTFDKRITQLKMEAES